MTFLHIHPTYEFQQMHSSIGTWIPEISVFPLQLFFQAWHALLMKCIILGTESKHKHKMCEVCLIRA